MSKKFYDDVLNLVAQVHTKKHKDISATMELDVFKNLDKNQQEKMIESMGGLDAGAIELLGKHVFDAIEAFKEGKLLPYTFGAKMKFYKSPYANQIFEFIYGVPYTIEKEGETVTVKEESSQGESF